ncbi:MAG: hypothetical protein QXV17_08200 [Candidatus Micrarchaeaceae archaeon]
MNNYKNGTNWEIELKHIFKLNNLVVLNLGFNEIGDLVVFDGKPRVIECKVVHNNNKFYLSRNPKQSKRLYELYSKGISVYYAVKFIINHKSYIRFFIIKEKNNPLVLTIDNGYSLTEFLEHVKKDIKNKSD